jgi:hypothetical protein
MTGPPNKRRRTTAIGPGSDVFAKATTHKTITTTNRSGMVVTKEILVPLVPIGNPSSSSSQLAWSDQLPQGYDGGFNNIMMDDDFDHPSRKKTKVCL